MVQRTGKAAKFPFPVHPHMLRHSSGYKLVNDGHDTRPLAHYLGHRNLQSTARYTALAPDRFAKFWTKQAAGTIYSVPGATDVGGRKCSPTVILGIETDDVFSDNVATYHHDPVAYHS
jgi:hypothetical protein